MLFPLFFAGAGFGFLASKQKNLAQKSPTLEVLKVAAWTVPVQGFKLFAKNTVISPMAPEAALLYGIVGAPISSLYTIGVGRQTAIMAATFYYAYTYTRSLNSQKEIEV